MRLFRIHYNGYYLSEYPRKVRDLLSEDRFYLSYAAAEANLPTIKLIQYDLNEMRDYGGDIRFYIEEMSAHDIFIMLRQTGEYYQGKNYWDRERWWRDYGDNYQYPHTFSDDPKLVEFFDHKADRVVTMKPGKFLKKYYDGVLTARQIAYYAEWWTTGEKPVIEAHLKFAKTEEEILTVYSDGPRSCMKGSESVSAYAAGDLAIAYLETNEGIRARALSWPEHKIYGRVYPNSENYSSDGFNSPEEAEAIRQTLITKLREEGYVSIQENPNGFDGARIKVQPYEQNGPDGYMRMPYLDNSLRMDFTADRGFVLMKDGQISSGTQNGYIRLIQTECSFCDAFSITNHGSSDNSRVCQSYEEYEYVSTSDHPTACSKCQSEKATRCTITGVHFLNDRNEFVPIYRRFSDTEPSYVIKEYFKRDRGWTSAKDGRSYLNYDQSPIWINGGTYHPDELFYSNGAGKYFLTDKERKQADKEVREEAAAREEKLRALGKVKKKGGRKVFDVAAYVAKTMTTSEPEPEPEPERILIPDSHFATIPPITRRRQRINQMITGTITADQMAATTVTPAEAMVNLRTAMEAVELRTVARNINLQMLNGGPDVRRVRYR